MSVILYINGQRIDTDSKTVIAQTKQVNDIANLSNRQCNFTNKIKIPKTANNVKALNYMAVPGNTSSVPYQKNECFLQSANGQVFVYKGWAVVADGGDYYNVTIYDGIIDLFKEIENKTLADLDLAAINQPKTIENIIDSWSADERPYRYIVADYNGNVGDSINGEINIDYLVPSVWISYLWERIQSYLSNQLNTEVKFEGSIFQSIWFKVLYMSYPKGLESTENDYHLVFHSNNYNPIVTDGSSLYQPIYATTLVNELAGSIDNKWLKVASNGTYVMKIKGKLYGKAGQLNKNSLLNIRKNGENLSFSSLYNSLYNITSYFGEAGVVLTYGEDFEIESQPFQLEQNETIGILIANETENESYQLYTDDDNYLEVELYKLEPVLANFSYELENFTIKDFINEIIQRFGLTIFKDPYSQTYTFLTMEEFIENTDYEDWSDKYITTAEETYKPVGSYSQNNYLRYKYNDKEGSYNDGYIGINNKNLPDKKDIYKSKIYSPERFPTTYYGNRLTNKYKLWEREINQEEEISYKQLDSRFYITKGEYYTYSSLELQTPFQIVSQELNQTQAATAAYFESFENQTFPEIVVDFYQPISKILDKSIIVAAEMWLTDDDVINFDFKKRYYIKQLGNYFIVNKISNYITGKPTKVELIRVIYAGEEELTGYEYGITVTNAYLHTSGGVELLSIEYNLQYTPQVGTELTFETSQNGQDWQSTGFTATTYQSANIPLSYLAPNQQYIRVHDITANVYSNTYFIQQ